MACNLASLELGEEFSSGQNLNSNLIAIAITRLRGLCCLNFLLQDPALRMESLKTAQDLFHHGSETDLLAAFCCGQGTWQISCLDGLIKQACSGYLGSGITLRREATHSREDRAPLTKAL